MKPYASPAGTAAGDAVVYIVDDEPSITLALRSLLASVDVATQAFHSVQDFLDYRRPDCASCLILDVRLRGGNGLALQESLSRNGDALPVIIMTGHGDIPMTVQAMKAGAVDFLTKPFNEQRLLDAVYQALQQDRERRASDEAFLGLAARYQTLSPREREVMEHATAGLMNKQIADRLGISDITVKIHRGNAMRKMQARSFAQLVTMAGKMQAWAALRGADAAPRGLARISTAG